MGSSPLAGLKCNQCEMPLLDQDGRCPFCGRRVRVVTTNHAPVRRGLAVAAGAFLFAGLLSLLSALVQAARGGSGGWVGSLVGGVIGFGMFAFMLRTLNRLAGV